MTLMRIRTKIRTGIDRVIKTLIDRERMTVIDRSNMTDRVQTSDAFWRSVCVLVPEF